MGVRLRLPTREMAAARPLLALSSSWEPSLLFRVEGTLGISPAQATRGSCSRRLAMRLIMDRWDTPASISNTDGKRRGIRVMYGPISSRVDSRKEDLVTQESINQQTQHLTMTTSTCRGWTPCR